ncbi:coproporphyrinogen dehydrogenase HemZ [Gudongella sp. DL1XJH-153]|uniref:coproporphyrinogen dehydrogenase HemZ n=1 Tax=Gudongella sp. DL1XJH-153 TaxID=3409804 RepID=UPI003BB55394
MINITTNDNSIKTQDPYELVRAFYGDKEVRIIHENNSMYENIEGDILEITLFDEFYQVSLIRNDRIIDKEKASYLDKEFYRGEKASRNNTIKHLIYKVLDRNLKTELPWGILTGIRPVKVSKMLIDKGMTYNEIIDVLTNSYLLRDDKAKLITEVSYSQRMILESIARNSYSIYIGIPFCPTKCFYCSFPTLIASKHSDFMSDYVDCIINELQDTLTMMKNWDLNTVYIGGGTPTSLPISLMKKILSYINENFSGIKELTVEAGRPDTIDMEYLQLFKGYKVNRISINPQSMNDNTLKVIGRKHSAEDIIETYRLSKKVGIETVNMDLIVGLPGEDRKDMENTLRILETLQPDNLTVHTLAMKKGSEFILERDNYFMASADEIQKMLSLTSEFALRNNMIPYYLYRQKQIMGNFENIGYSKRENPCVYNISIMEEKETIIGIGMGSTTKLYNKVHNSIDTIANFRNLREYMDRLSELKSRKRQKIKEIEDSWDKIHLDI